MSDWQATGIYQDTRKQGWSVRLNGTSKHGYSSALAALAALEELTEAAGPANGKITCLTGSPEPTEASVDPDTSARTRTAAARSPPAGRSAWAARGGRLEP